jgi:saccharopine dehydrogenase (NAD+, L-lysine-forming)
VQKALEGVEVVVQATVPRYNASVQSAALAVGANYVDLAADSSEPFGASDEWRSHGLLGLIGMGGAPGLSNLMARRSADGMDRVESIRVRDGDTVTSPEHPFLTLFSPETFIDRALRTSRIWDGGKYRDVPPFGEGETYAFPPPLGPRKVYSVNHEEVDSLPRFIGKDLDYVDFKRALDDNTVRILQVLKELNLLEPGTPEAPGPRKVVISALPKPGELAGRVEGNAAIVVETTGEAGGLRRQETLHTVLSHPKADELYHSTATAYLTGTPAAVAVELVAAGKIRERGLLPPEALDPARFFAKLRDRGIVVTERRTIERDLGGGRNP